MMTASSIKSWVSPFRSLFSRSQNRRMRNSNVIRSPGQDIASIATLNAQSGEFQRIEDKVLLSNKQAANLLADVHRYMRPSYFHEGTEFTLVASYYFDGPELNFFQHHFMQLPTRYKLRIRRYAPNGVWSDDASLVELKFKENGVSKKRRFYLTKDNYNRLMNGLTLKMSDELLTMNPRINEEKLSKRLNKINELILEFGLRPVLKVQYKRFAYEAQDFRLTIDRNLEIEMLSLNVPEVVKDRLLSSNIWPEAKSMVARYNKLQHCIVELKHCGQLPQWVERFMKQHHIEATSFSKYCWGVNELVNQETAPKAQ